jgi:hypothetical protein
MAKLVHDNVLDAALQYLETNVDFLSVCEGAPTTYEHAHSNKGTATGKVLASSATPTFTGPADDTSGRKTAVDEEAAMTVDISGTADHVALCFTGSTLLLYVTTCTSQALTAGNTVTVPTWDISIADPT